jgi:hypothetical protein
MLALTSATGKLGGAVLNAILDNKLIDPKDLVVCVRTFLSLFPTSSNITTSDLLRPQHRQTSVPPRPIHHRSSRRL